MKLFLLLLTILFSNTALATEKYKLVMNESGSGNWGAIRYEPTTGRSWHVKDSIFIEILEQELPEKSNYIIKIAKTNRTWSAVRMDTNSGKAWIFKDKMWKKILESN